VGLFRCDTSLGYVWHVDYSNRQRDKEDLTTLFFAKRVPLNNVSVLE